MDITSLAKGLGFVVYTLQEKEVTVMRNELKPCPFCGTQPILRHKNIMSDLSFINPLNCHFATWWEVICPNCGTRKEGGESAYRLTNDETVVLIDKRLDGKKKAIEEWNRRVDNAEN